MHLKLLTGLGALGYVGPLLQKVDLELAVNDGTKSIEYTKLVNYLTNELRTLLNIDEEVNVITCPEDSVAFVMEVTSFLKELNCPYLALIQGHISDRLQTIEDKLLLLDYLSTQLMTARIIQEKLPDRKLELKLQETDEAACVRKMLMTLRFPKPPPNITITQLFQKVCPTVQSVVDKNKELVGSPAFNGSLSDKQWETLNNVQADLHNEYRIRREMLLTRLDVTIQSFQWSDKTKGKNEEFEKIYAEKRKRLKTDPEVELADLLASRDEIAIIEKTSNSSVRKNTQSSLNKVIIGQVPDRGGRTSEQAPPPPEMPSWQQRSTGGGSRGGRGGGNYSRSDFKNKQNYSRDSASYSGGYSTNQAGYENRSSYESNHTEKNNYTCGRSFDSAGSYNSNYGASGGYSRDSFDGNKGDYSNTRNNYNDRSFDSAGSYGKDYQYEQNSKRPKTYDSFQSNRTTYTDQYVQEEQHNQQYHGRGGSRSRGRGQSNYNRGSRNRY